MILGKKNFLILGFTYRTGFHTAKFLAQNGCNVYISDKVRDNDKENLLSQVRSVAKGEVFDLLGTENLDLDEIEMVISSPGVPLSNPIIVESLKRGIEVIGDIELFYRLRPEVNYIAITGTDGKTTTTNLTYRVLNEYLPYTLMAGNVGIPVFSIFDQRIDNLVLEVSSFQIDTTKEFKPKIGVITNIAKDHLDRYSSFDDYVNSKFSLFKNSDEKDIAILNKSLFSFSRVMNLKSQKIFFSAYEKQNDGIRQIYLDNGYICFEGNKIVNVNNIKLLGKHNIENIMVAVGIGVIMGVDKEVIEKVIYSFEPLPHRMEFVCEINGVKYVNDSKATTINAMVSAIKSLDNPIVLIAGGLDKGVDFQDAVAVISEKVKYVIAIGSTRDLIENRLLSSGYKNCFKVDSLYEAVVKAMEVAKEGDVVLFSPGYASFDMFKNYEDRGECFKKIVKDLKSDL